MDHETITCFFPLEHLLGDLGIQHSYRWELGSSSASPNVRGESWISMSHFASLELPPRHCPAVDKPTSLMGNGPLQEHVTHKDKPRSGVVWFTYTYFEAHG